MRDLRTRSEDELVELALPRLADMLRAGTTTAEVKSGYGLSTRRRAENTRGDSPPGRPAADRAGANLLGAHELPLEFREQRNSYVDLVVNEMIPAVAAEGLARFCDVFMEPGVFDRAQSERILRAGLEHGLVPQAARG